MSDGLHVSLPGTAAESVAESAADLHVVRPSNFRQALASGAAPVSRWIDPATGRVWGSPSSSQLYDLAIEAVRDEQKARERR